MNNQTESPLKTLLFIAITLAMCVLFSVFSLTSSASMIFSICFERTESDKLLAGDTEWTGDGELVAQRQTAADKGRAALEALVLSEGRYSADTASSLFIKAPAELTYKYYSQGADKAVILLHGYNRTEDFSLMYVPYWVEKGYDIIIPQLRCHDGAAGVTTLGFYEQYDLCDLMRQVKSDVGTDSFVLHGQGMGAVSALLLSGNEEHLAQLEEECEISLIVAESAYTTMAEMIEHQLLRQFEMKGFHYVWSMRIVIDQTLGILCSEADTPAAAAKSDIPTLFVSGSEDTFVPAEMTQTIYNSCAAEKDILTVPGAHFGSVWTDAMESGSYTSAIDAMLN